MITNKGKKAYVTKEARNVIGVTLYDIRQYISNGQPKAKKVGGRLCIFANSLKAFVDSVSKKEEVDA